MATKATILKATVQLSDMDRNYYDTLHLTLAQHPSENDQRLIIRLLCFIINADPQLKFGKGVSDEDEAAIWQINYSDEIEHWIELGQLEQKRIKKACNQAQKVSLYCYGSSADTWWKQNQNHFHEFKNLTIKQFSAETCEQLLPLVSRNMDFQCSIQDDQLWLTAGDNTLLIETTTLKELA